MAGRNMCTRRTNPAVRCRSRRAGRVCWCRSRRAWADRINPSSITAPTGSTPSCRFRTMRPTSCTIPGGRISVASPQRQSTPLPNFSARDFWKRDGRRCPQPISRRAGRTPGLTRRPATAPAPITAAMCATAAPSSRRSCWRCSAATTARPASRSRSRRSCSRRTSCWPGTRSACRYRIIPRASAAPAVRTRSAARSWAMWPPTCPWCWHSSAANSRRGTGTKRPAAPSPPITTSRSTFLPPIKMPSSSCSTNTISPLSISSPR